MEELRYLKTKLIDEMNKIATVVGGGGCADYNQYMEAVGKIRGMDVAVNMIDTFLEKQKEEEDKANANLTPVKTGV